MNSQYFSNGALKALNRIGDLLIPANGEFPSFSQYGGIEHIDKLVSFAPPGDIKDLNLLLTILSYLPSGILRWLVNKMENAQYSDGALSSLFRQLDFGLRGLVFSCYYSGRPGAQYKGTEPLDVIGFSLTRVED